jgi:hypothetical protein
VLGSVNVRPRIDYARTEPPQNRLVDLTAERALPRRVSDGVTVA